MRGALLRSAPPAPGGGAPGGSSGVSALMWLGTTFSAYTNKYELKATSTNEEFLIRSAKKAQPE